MLVSSVGHLPKVKSIFLHHDSYVKPAILTYYYLNSFTPLITKAWETYQPIFNLTFEQGNQGDMRKSPRHDGFIWSSGPHC